MKNLSPMMSHYIKTKEKYKDAVLFYRVGDFYEMFFEDAKEVSKMLDLVLSDKSCGNGEKAPMCGVPYHSYLTYVRKLISLGKKVAICEQITTEANSQGVVDREVVKILTPGTIVDEEMIDSLDNNYIMCILSLDGIDNNEISIVDVSTGEVSSYKSSNDELSSYFFNYLPNEIIINEKFSKKLESKLIQNSEIISEYINRNNIITNYYKGENLEDFIKENSIPEEMDSLIIIFKYIFSTQKIFNYKNFHHKDSSDFMMLDYGTLKNLEITENIRSNNGLSLFKVINKTCTAMGSRTLKDFLTKPLLDISKINKRLDLVQVFFNNIIKSGEIIDKLNNIYDLERISNKIIYENIKKNDLINLKNSIFNIFYIKNLLQDLNDNNIKENFDEINIDELNYIYTLLENSIDDSLESKHLIKSEYNESLKYYRNLINNSTDILLEIEKEEKEKTGAKTLKIGYNKVFGYYIEITKASLKTASIPKDYIRKQTLVSSERFINEKLKKIELEIIEAKEKSSNIETELYQQIITKIQNKTPHIIKASSKIALIDFAISLARVARENNYVRPIFSKDNNLIIKNGRHPIIEKIIKNENFIPNDTEINDEEIHIITGPNMAGKSTYMRQVALIVIMAQIGSFVPAEFASIPVVDKVLTRIGANDDLTIGQSTFMVEMVEVSYIIKNATKNSLILLDEIGRGTSTYDGMSLAYAIIEYIAKIIKAKSLISTHYHELTILEEKYKNIINYCILVEDESEVKFLRKVIPGKADKSYGIHVANLAGLPMNLLQKASEILVFVESGGKISSKKPRKNPNLDSYQISMETLINNKNQNIITEIKNLDPNLLSPKDALDFIYYIKEKIDE